MLASKQIIIEQTTLDEWIIEQLRDKLQKAISHIFMINKPIVLYTRIMEEAENSTEEEIAILDQKYVVVQVIANGGFIPTGFQQQFVLTLDEFPTWIMKRSHSLFMQCMESLDGINQQMMIL